MAVNIRAVRTVQEQVVHNLRALILEGDFTPGDKLRQEELAAQLSVSAMPVREGLRQLQAEGLVEFQPRHGSFVTSLCIDELDELFRMREELEVLSLEWAVKRIGPEDREKLHSLLEDVEEAEAEHDVARRSLQIRRFLMTLFEASGCNHLCEAIRRYYNMTYLYQRKYSAALDVAPKRMQLYRRMLNAIESGDVQGTIAAYRDTYRLVRETLFALLRQDAEKADGED